MPIDPLQEQVLSLSDAAKTLPRTSRGKHRHVTTLYRWTSTGCRGVVLESIQIGASRYTSLEALGRFFEALSLHTGPGSHWRKISDRSAGDQEA